MDYLKQVGQALGLVKFELAKLKPHLQMAKTRYELVSSKRERLHRLRSSKHLDVKREAEESELANKVGQRLAIAFEQRVEREGCN